MCAMAESSFCSEVIGSDMETLREALGAQQQLLEKLYSELDEEREASSSATSEAMSMILRLQGEKSQMKMEASQYKREAEGKLCLAEESFAIYEDLMYQKEMEIAFLEFQVQAYRCKLVGMGCNDLSIPECRFPEGLYQQRNDSAFTETGVHRIVKRHDSLPSLYVKKPDMIPRNVDQVHFEKKAGISGGGDLNLYWARIRKLDGQVKEISDLKMPHRAYSMNSGSRQFRSCSLPPPDPEDSRLSSSPPPSDGMGMSVDQAKNPTNALSYSFVQDKFEVPQNNETCKAQERLISEGEKRHRKPAREGSFELQVKDKDKSEFRNNVPLCPKHKDNSSKQREKTITGRQFSLPSMSSIASDYQVDIQRLKQRIERLEAKENNTRQEIIVEEEPGLAMLKEVLAQINALQSELRNCKTKKSSHPDNPRLDSIGEAMLYFWL